MPRVSAAAAAQTAQRILDAATALFAVRGFADVSIDDVAQAAEVTRGAVYHHYRSKGGLFGAVAAGLQSHVATAVVAAAERSGGDAADARLKAGSHAFLDAITTGPAVRILLVDAPSVLGWQEWRRQDDAHSAAHLREALRDVGVADAFLDATAVQLSGAMNEVALWIAEHEDPAAARAQAHAALDRLLVAFLP